MFRVEDKWNKKIRFILRCCKNVNESLTEKFSFNSVAANSLKLVFQHLQ